MTYLEAKVIILSADVILATELVAALFYDLGISGVLIEDPQCGLVDRRDRSEAHAVSAYFLLDGRIEQTCRHLETGLKRLKTGQHIQTRVVYRHVDAQDWSESWKAFFRPQKIGRRLVVKPSWHQYERQPEDIILEIDPGMAFGTGTHPTTRSCLELIEAYLKPQALFLDIGTGSGILMVAAAKLGAAKACGIDNDDDAVKIARQNLLLNKIPQEKFDLIGGNLVDSVHGKYDLVAANILAEVIIDLLDEIKRVLADDAVFIASGILAEHRERVLEKIRAQGFEILDILAREEWVAIAARRPQR